MASCSSICPSFVPYLPQPLKIVESCALNLPHFKALVFLVLPFANSIVREMGHLLVLARLKRPSRQSVLPTWHVSTKLTWVYSHPFSSFFGWLVGQSKIANIFIVICHDFCLLPASFCSKVTSGLKFGIHMRFTVLCAPRRIVCSDGHLCFQALRFQNIQTGQA